MAKIKNLIYVKLSRKPVHCHRDTCNAILNDPTASHSDKAIALRILSDMNGKQDDDYHTVWYVGETSRTLEERMKEAYPLILRRFGVTDQFQIAQATEGNDHYTTKFLRLILESIVAGCIQGSINNANNLTPIAYWDMSNINSINTGHVNYQKVHGTTVLTTFCRRYCTDENKHKAVRAIAQSPSINSYIRKNKVWICHTNGITYTEGGIYIVEPTILQLCIYLGYQGYKRKVNDCFDQHGEECLRYFRLKNNDPSLEMNDINDAMKKKYQGIRSPTACQTFEKHSKLIKKWAKQEKHFVLVTVDEEERKVFYPLNFGLGTEEEKASHYVKKSLWNLPVYDWRLELLQAYGLHLGDHVLFGKAKQARTNEFVEDAQANFSPIKNEPTITGSNISSGEEEEDLVDSMLTNRRDNI